MQLTLNIPQRHAGECDCGSPSVAKDGSGEYCLECKSEVDRASDLDHKLLLESRAEIFFDLRIEQERAKQARWNAKQRQRRAA